MTGDRNATRIDRWSVLVVVVLAIGAILGAGGGLWLGYHGPGAREANVAVLPSPSVPPSSGVTVAGTASQPSEPTASPQSTEVSPLPTLLTFGGSANQVSEPFDAMPGWQIQWQTDGGQFSFAVTGDQNLGTVIDQPGPASGLISIAPGGTFRVSVNAKGPWRIVVSQGRG
jgi:hypothetical protein